MNTIAIFGARELLKPDWKKFFGPESVKPQLRVIAVGKPQQS